MEIKYLCKVCKRARAEMLIVSYSGKNKKLFFTSICSNCFSSGTDLKKCLVIVGPNATEFINKRSIKSLEKVDAEAYRKLKEFLKEKYNIIV